jgi:hypothetical protein
MVDGKEVHNTIGMRPECWNARPNTRSEASAPVDAPPKREDRTYEEITDAAISKLKNDFAELRASPPVIDEAVAERIGRAILREVVRHEPNAVQRYGRAALETGCAGLVAEKWQLIETLEAPYSGFPVLIYVPTVGVAIARSRYGASGLGSATHWMPLPEPPRTALRGDREKGEG